MEEKYESRIKETAQKEIEKRDLAKKKFYSNPLNKNKKFDYFLFSEEFYNDLFDLLDDMICDSIIGD